jgi:16S rRNA (guanine527-N7)-methyltransferase
MFHVKHAVADLLVPALEERGARLSEEAAALFSDFLEELMVWNQKINLHGYKTEEDVVINLFLDSLAPYFLGIDIPDPLLDLGTGAGVPGLPLKFVHPRLQTTLLDARKKKLAFIQHVIDGLEIEKASTLWGRAEEIAHRKEMRESFGTVTAKAIGQLSEIAELSLPLLRKGGILIAYKGARSSEEIDKAGKALKLLGGTATSTQQYSLPGIRESRSLIIVTKTGHSPQRFPRKAGTPHSEPL